MELFRANCVQDKGDELTLNKHGKKYMFKLESTYDGQRVAVVLRRTQLIPLLQALQRELQAEQTPTKDAENAR